MSTAKRPPTRIEYADPNPDVTAGLGAPFDPNKPIPRLPRLFATLWSEGPYPGARYRYRGDQHPEHTTEWQPTPELALEAFNKLGAEP